MCPRHFPAPTRGPRSGAIDQRGSGKRSRVYCFGSLGEVLVHHTKRSLIALAFVDERPPRSDRFDFWKDTLLWPCHLFRLRRFWLLSPTTAPSESPEVRPSFRSGEKIWKCLPSLGTERTEPNGSGKDRRSLLKRIAPTSHDPDPKLHLKE